MLDEREHACSIRRRRDVGRSCTSTVVERSGSIDVPGSLA
jgi:hypothetical protein